MLGVRDLRAFCRPPMGVPVEFAGVSTYADGQPVCGLFDRPMTIRQEFDGGGGVQSASPELRLPFDAFSPMPRSGDVVSITDLGLTTRYRVNPPTDEDDGAYMVYELIGTGEAPTAAVQASADNGQSIASDILDAVVAILGGPPQAFRCRFQNFGLDELPVDNVLPDTEDPEFEHAWQIDQRFRFFVRHMAAGTSDLAEKAADAQYVRGQRLLLANPTLNGLVHSIRPRGLKWDIDSRETENVVCVATYEAEFSTSPRDPSVAGF